MGTDALARARRVRLLTCDVDGVLTDGRLYVDDHGHEMKAFSAICTHEGCLVGSVVDNEIICPCHDARFSATDGSVLQGPATEPLAESAVSVQGGNVVLDA